MVLEISLVGKAASDEEKISLKIGTRLPANMHPFLDFMLNRRTAVMEVLHEKPGTDNVRTIADEDNVICTSSSLSGFYLPQPPS